MIQIEQIRHYFPAQIREDSMFDKYMLKEYLQLMILDYCRVNAIMTSLVRTKIPLGMIYR